MTAEAALGARPLAGATERVTTVVIGAGHNGLAASHYLTEHSIDHVVLERGEVANTWLHDRWDSLRLLTPNWLTRLPGLAYDGDDPDGYMSAGEIAGFIQTYAARSGAPVRAGTTVTAVEADADGGYRVETDAGAFSAQTVVIASGAFSLPTVPALADAVPADVAQLTAGDYRNPNQLDEGGVLVVGAAATGVQLAGEIAAAGHRVLLSVGEHVRMPRTYRGRDVLWWMDATGIWDEGYGQVDDLNRARGLPSPQLIGTPERRTVDLNSLQAQGIELVGRIAAVREGEALFSGGLRNALGLADLKLNRLLDSFDAWASEQGIDAELGAPNRPEQTQPPASPRLKLDLRGGAVRTIVWATGFRPDYAWLKVPVLDAKGRLRHDGGVITESPGLYALGLPVLRRRRSTFIHGAQEDAREVVGQLAMHLQASSSAIR